MDPEIVATMRSHFADARCPRRVVVCLLYDENMSLLSWGVNGPVEHDCFMQPCQGNLKRGKKRCQALHAEDVAVSRLGATKPYYAFISRSPCVKCCEKLIAAGVYEVHVCSYDFNHPRDSFLRTLNIKFVVE